MFSQTEGTRVDRKITLRELENFVALAEHKSVTGAALSVKLSQPAMSAALKALEVRLQADLFVRHRGQGISLTPEGEVLLVEARALLSQANDLEARMSDLVTASSGRLVIASLVTVAPIVVPSLVRKFREASPNVEVEMRTGSQDQILVWLQSGEIHTAITYDLDLSPTIHFDHIYDAAPHALLPARHKFAGHKSIKLSQLAAEPYILLDLPVSRKYFTSLFLASDVPCQPERRETDLALVRSLVANGFGYSLVNLLPATDDTQDGKQVAYVPLEVPIRPIGLGLARRTSDNLTRSESLFIEFARAELVLPR